jgi:Ca2+-binding RTX toxin-like protein
MEPTVIKVEIDGDNIDIRYSDGSRERIEFGVYELRDADGKRVERHRATEDDVARLEEIASNFEGDTTSDDGTPDQGTGDAPSTEGADDTTAPGDDDGTPDQGTGDAPGTDGADDTTTPGDDDGTPDQGPGDAPGTGSGGDDTGGDDSGSDLVLIEGTDAGERIRGTNADERIEGNGGDDRLEGRGGDDVINGGAGDDEVRGGRGNDVLNGDSGDDDLWGDAGADTFVFSDGGQDKIHDFEPGIDRIDVSAYGFADAAAVLASTFQEGPDSFVDLGGGDIIKIDDIALAQLSEGDFIV